SCARPGYGSTPDETRVIAHGASTTAAVLDAAQVDRAAVLGYSGGGPHALAAGALLGDRIVAAVCFASPAPYTGTESWFRGMAGGGAALRAALEGRPARTFFEETEEFDPSSFNDDDYRALAGTWQALGEDVERSFGGTGHAGLIDDDLALVRPWGAALGEIRAPVGLWHGSDDGVIPVAHSRALLSEIPSATLEVVPGAGHVSVLNRMADAYDWILAH
ncbi:MAG: alpha/beta hydrolase, partial [Pseudolysinimonas sp.]